MFLSFLRLAIFARLDFLGLIRSFDVAELEEKRFISLPFLPSLTEELGVYAPFNSISFFARACIVRRKFDFFISIGVAATNFALWASDIFAA
jgi:hypothetical protein